MLPTTKYPVASMNRVMARSLAFFFPPYILCRLNHIDNYKNILTCKVTSFCNENSKFSCNNNQLPISAELSSDEGTAKRFLLCVNCQTCFR